MRTDRYYPFLLLWVLTLLGCQRNVGRQLSEADRIICEKPDSAFKILNGIDTAARSHDEKMLHLLLTVKAKTKLNMQIDGDTLLSEVVKHYFRRGDSLEMQSKYYYGVSLNQQKNYEDALVQLLPAYDQAKEQNDNFYQGLISGELAFIFRDLQATDQQLFWALNEKDHFKSAGYPIYAAWADITILSALIHSGKYKEGWKVLENIDTVEYNKSAFFREYVESLKGSILHSLRQPAKSISVYKKLHEDFGSLNAGQWAYVARDNLKLGRLDESKAAIDSAYAYAEDQLDSVNVWYVDALLKARDGDYRKAYETAMKFGEGIMQDGDERLASPPVMPLVDTLRENVAMERKLASEERTKVYLITAIGLLAVAVLVLVVFLQRNRLRNREREIETALAHAGELDTYLTALEEKSAEDHRRYEAVCRRVEELDGEVRNERELSGEFIEEIRSLYSTRMKSLNSLLEIWHRYDGTNIPPKHFYKNITEELEKLRGGESLSEMESIIDRHYDGWMRRFRDEFPKLSKDQYALTVYLFLGFSVGAITMLMGKSSVNAVYTAKSRLKSQLTEVSTPRAIELRRSLGL